MESITSHIGVVVVAGGSGSRMGGNLPKQFMLLDGQPILARTINNFAEALPGAEIVVVLPADYIDFWQDYARRFDVAEHRTTAGGAERFHSVANGIAALSDACDLIAVQDGVRPLATHEAIRRIARTAEREGSAIPVVQPVDSFRIVTAEGASHPVERATLRIVQTPQFFRAELLRKAYACTYDPAFTDDATVVEAAGGVLRLVEGETTNLKITTRDDLAVAEAILARRTFYILVLALIGLGLHSLYIGGYLSAWFVSLVVALFALMSLSIPRKIVVKKATVEILCLLDMTEIPRMEIASVQRVDPRRVVPLFGGYGFFGYYGYYFDLKTFEKVVVYASEWKNLVEIVDIYEQRYYVSCTQADELVALLQSE